ncbi:hypothetical protein SAMN05444365_11372 [Micromonospora pattaloongensis]|uniref:Uncharacterized protein n=1 Tax=Micromonospora pattaloongensis TaxID=405436 RepID=A0A1H3SQP5_9ACTN|nr:hypothetical protein [Micromonospora pattaloongensis]SDZ40403.1 hypothetical protein SAMN05444365_11372 [Micromonospora pattaloongensis]
MSQAEVTHSAGNERCCVRCDQGQQLQPPIRGHHRLLGPRRIAEPVDAPDPTADAPDPTGAPPADDGDPAMQGWGATCQSWQEGWAGAHRHGAVRPRKRKNRRERPPRRWC